MHSDQTDVSQNFAPQRDCFFPPPVWAQEGPLVQGCFYWAVSRHRLFLYWPISRCVLGEGRYKSNPSATALAGDQPLKSTIMDYQRGSFKSLRPCEWGITLAKRWVIMGYHLTGVDPPDVKF